MTTHFEEGPVVFCDERRVALRQHHNFLLDVLDLIFGLFQVNDFDGDHLARVVQHKTRGIKEQKPMLLICDGRFMCARTMFLIKYEQKACTHMPVQHVRALLQLGLYLHLKFPRTTNTRPPGRRFTLRRYGVTLFADLHFIFKSPVGVRRRVDRDADRNMHYELT